MIKIESRSIYGDKSVVQFSSAPLTIESACFMLGVKLQREHSGNFSATILRENGELKIITPDTTYFIKEL